MNQNVWKINNYLLAYVTWSLRICAYCSAAVAWLVASTDLVFSQIPPPGTGKTLPPSYFQRIHSQSDAFSVSKGFISLVQLLSENRQRIATSHMPAFAAAVANQHGGTVVAGTKFLPVVTSVSSDLPNEPYDKAVLAREYFDGPWPTGTLSNFYGAMSYGYLNVKGKVLDWQKLSQPVDWYAGGDFPDQNGNMQPCNGLCSYSHIGQLITELLDKNRNIDWGQFDNDGPDRQPNSGDDDGNVDFIVIVHPGVGAECGPAGNHHIWSHRGQLKYENGIYLTPTPSKTPGFGSIQINDYVIVPALACDGISPNPIGVAAHEFGHAFFLPDLYDTDQVTVGGVGNWDLMATGAWGGDGNAPTPETPTQMSAWAKESLGWITPLPITADIADIALDPIAVHPMAYKISVDASHYYLLSNRQPNLSLDSHLPAQGLLVEAINQDRLDQASTSNQINTDVSNLGVQVVEADGRTGLTDPLTRSTSFRASSGDLFPVSVNPTNFDALSTPPNPGNFAICGIHQIGTAIHASVLVSTNVCPSTAALSVLPFAETMDLQIQGIGKAKANATVPKTVIHPSASLADVLESPASYEGHTVAIKGIIENTGKNYFTQLRLTLTDQTGRTIPVKIDAPTEVIPPPAGTEPPHSPPVSAYLDRLVSASGTIIASDIPGRPKTYVLHITNVSPDNDR